MYWGAAFDFTRARDITVRSNTVNLSIQGGCGQVVAGVRLRDAHGVVVDANALARLMTMRRPSGS